MAGHESASEADLNALDATLSRIFGRSAPVQEGEPSWRTGPVGELTVEELDESLALTFDRRGVDQVEVARRVAETDRQIAVERQLLERAGRIGWPAAVSMVTGADRSIAESVRHRAGGATAPAGGASLAEARRTGAGRPQRVEIREVDGWNPPPIRGR